VTSLTAGQVAVLLNPTAGRGRFREQLPAILDALRAGGRELAPLAADTPEEALRACQAAVDGGAGAVVAVGGDGTLHLALQAVAGTGVPFGAVPAGTGNDFVVDLGLPAEPVAAARAVAAALRDGRTRPVDLALMTGAGGQRRWFGAVLAAGFDAIVNERANRMRFPKGPRRYDIAIVVELLRLRPRPYTLCLDGVEHRVDAVLVAVGNTASYGGGMRICPAADPTDGLLDVVVGARMGRGTLLRIKPRLYQGTHVEHPLVTTYRAATVELAAEGITAYVDGERAFPLPVTVTSVPGALTLLDNG
jgi:diacylglycerol kinase (ATP)